MKIYETADIGALVQRKRKEMGFSQPQLADLCGCGTRFISDLENGKPTMHIGKAINVLLVLGLDITISERGCSHDA